MERWPLDEATLTPQRRRDWAAPMSIQWTDRLVGARVEGRVRSIEGTIAILTALVAGVAASMLRLPYEAAAACLLIASGVALATIWQLERLRHPRRLLAMTLDTDRIRVSASGVERAGGIQTVELLRKDAVKLELSKLGVLNLYDAVGQIRIRLPDRRIALPPDSSGSSRRARLSSLVGAWWPDRDSREREDGRPWDAPSPHRLGVPTVWGALWLAWVGLAQAYVFGAALGAWTLGPSYADWAAWFCAALLLLIDGATAVTLLRRDPPMPYA
jgi:hypothetical protein